MKWVDDGANADVSTKLQKLQDQYGIKGYGMYFYVMNLMVHDKGLDRGKWGDDVKTISRDIGCDSDLLDEVMGFALAIGLFEESSLLLITKIIGLHAAGPIGDFNA